MPLPRDAATTFSASSVKINSTERYFLLHHLEVIRASFDSLKEFIRGKREEAGSLRRSSGAGGGFSHRQIALLKHAS